MPDGVSYEGVFGLRDAMKEADVAQVAASGLASGTPAPQAPAPYALLAAEPLRRERRLAQNAATGRGDKAAKADGGVVGGVTGGVPGSRALMSVPEEREARIEGPAGDDRPSPRAQSQHRQAGAAIENARRLRAARRTDAAARELALAVNLEQARLRAAGRGDDGTLSALLAELAELTNAREEQATAALPALGRPLAFVIRNADLEAALQEVARAAGVTVVTAASALDDARSALGSRGVRAGYLDLRGVSAARALTWLTQPAGLVWSLSGRTVRVSSAHRPPEALPAAEGPASLQAEQRDALASLRAWTWPLLAAALQGRIDEAAASELLEAWSVPGVADSVGTSPLPLRSLWSIALARRTHPDDPTLRRLWDVALASVRAAAARPAAGPAHPAVRAYAELLGAMGVDGLPSPGAAAGAGLEALRDQGGDDAFVLTAFSLRRQGGEAWTAFRESAAERARRAGASGGALQVANRLEGARAVAAGLRLE
jgi:hypothetical protein